MSNALVNKANKYARDVVSVRVDACIYVRQACQRHLDDLQKQKDPKFPYRFDREKGEKICQFAQNMVHVKGKWAGEKMVLQPWQCFCLAAPFGWVRKSDGMRRFREMYLEIPRKNGKSQIGAIIGNYMFAADGEEGSEVYSGATTENQAWEVFRPAKLMAMRSPGFKEFFGVEPGTMQSKTMFSLKSASRFQPVVGNPGDGSSPHCALVDEFHEHKTPDLYDTMITGMGARTQPMLCVITTAGSNLAGPCYDKRGQVVKVLAGQFENDELFGCIYTLDESDDWSDFALWPKANPNFGISVFEDYLEARHREATQRASRQNIIRCKHLNQWMNADAAWMNMLEWAQCKTEMSIEDFRGMPCWIGIDLASKTDIAAKVTLFERDGHFYAFGRYYLPADTINRPENTHYQGWRHEDLIVETPGAVTDYGLIEDDLKDDVSAFDVQEICYDPWQATQMAVRMMDEGFTMVEVRATVQNFTEPMKALEALILERKFHFDGDPVLTWMMSNVVAHTDKKDNIYPNKERAENKIDGVIAILMALGRAILTESEQRMPDNWSPIFA